MHVIITGGLGFIGSSIAKRLLSEGTRVSIIDDSSTAVRTNVPGADTFKINMMDHLAIKNINIPAADCVMHLCGPSSGPASAVYPVETLSGGHAITFNALEVAKKTGTKKFLMASSMTVYGNTSNREIPVTEDQPCNPISYYGISKFANERLVEVYCLEHKIEFNNLRLFNVYGPGQKLSRGDQGLVSIFLSLLMKSSNIVSRGSLERFRDIIHIEDVVSAFCLCAETGIRNGPINVGSGMVITIGELIRKIADALNIADQLKVEVCEPVPGDIFGIYADIETLKKATGFNPVYQPADGILQFADWARRENQGFT